MKTEKIWLGSVEVDEIIKKIEMLAPGLTQFEDASGNLVPTALTKSLKYKIENANSRRRDKLQLVGQEIGKIDSFFHLYNIYVTFKICSKEQPLSVNKLQKFSIVPLAPKLRACDN